MGRYFFQKPCLDGPLIRGFRSVKNRMLDGRRLVRKLIRFDDAWQLLNASQPRVWPTYQAHKSS